MPPIAQEEDDPVIAEYDIYITKPATVSPAVSDTRLLLLQYPSHRPSSRPYNAARGQKPTALRLKPESGLLEVDVPILTHEHYNTKTGIKLRKALQESRVAKEGGSHGLAGGFNTTGTTYHQSLALADIPAYDEESAPENELETQTLGGKIAKPTTGDPIYMLGCIRNNELHLSHLDALVQLRPQFHHLDAQDELERKRSMQTAASGRAKPGLEATPKIETKAVDVKLKDKTYDERDRGMNNNARLLRAIQVERFRTYEWIDEDDPASWRASNTHMYLPTDTLGETKIAKLQSKLNNSDWLDRMSAPRETGHGKKGLLGKLRGRERERARRKKTEEERRRRAKASGENAGTTSAGDKVVAGVAVDDDDDDEDSDLTDLDDTMDEADGLANTIEGATAQNAQVIDDDETPAVKDDPEPAPKKRGRPKKS